MSSPILIKPHSFEWGFFYYFRFDLKNLLIYFIIAYSAGIAAVKAQSMDSLRGINVTIDSLINSGESDFDVLFYKHYNNVLMNNTGSFGSAWYVPSTFNILNGKEEWMSNYPENWLNISKKKPLSNIKYINASRKEQIFSIMHLQNFGEFLELNFKLDKVSSPGAYSNQEANFSVFKGELKFNTRRKVYQLKVYTELERGVFEENGGLENITFFEVGAFESERTYSVRLFQSERKEKINLFGISQRLNLFTSNRDSGKAMTTFMAHDFKINTEERVFYDNDPLSSLYQNVFLDSSATIDSIYTDNFSNEFSIGLSSINMTFSILGQFDIKSYEQIFGIDTSYLNSYLGARFSFAKNDSKFSGLLKLGVSGYRSGDIDMNVRAMKKFDQNEIDVRGYFYLNEAILGDVNYTSNHFYWRNYNLSKQGIMGLRSSFHFAKLKLDLLGEFKSVSSLIYLDTNAVISQLDELIQFGSLCVEKKFSVWRFNLISALVYQFSSDKTNIPLPELVVRQVAYYQKKIFKGALKIQLGASVSYATDYYGYSYMPALGRFYSQESKQLGQYPSVDVFLNTHLKRAQIFLKYEHLNAGSNLERAISAPGYPLLNKSFKFGVSWNLFD